MLGPSPNSCVETPPLDVRRWAFGWQVGHEGGALIHGISVLMKMMPTSSFILFLPREDMGGWAAVHHPDEGSHQTWASTQTSDFQNWEK